MFPLFSYAEVNKNDGEQHETAVTETIGDEEGDCEVVTPSFSRGSSRASSGTAYIIYSFLIGGLMGAILAAMLMRGYSPIGSAPEERAVSYNFLRTPKGSQTLRLLIKDLLQSQSHQEQNRVTSEGHSSLSGPRRALAHLSELMEGDAQIHSSCHPLAHNLGRTAYQFFGSLDAAYDGMVGTEDAQFLRLCNAAYMHGVIELHLRDVDDLDSLGSAAREIDKNVCNELINVDDGDWECRHGIGHGIIQRYRLEAEKDTIQKGLHACNAISDALVCQNGLWMDHFAVSGQVRAMETKMMAVDVVATELKGALSSLDRSQQDYIFSGTASRFQLPPLPSTLQICNLGSEEYGCFIYAATEYLLVHPDDYVGALQYCTDPSANISADGVDICIKGVGSQCAKENMDDFSIVEEICQTLDNKHQGILCFRSAVEYFQMSSGGNTAGESGPCDKLTHYKNMCFCKGGEWSNCQP